jgi:tellurite resistance protein TerB
MVSVREHVAPIQAEIIEPSNVHERAAAALVTVGAMVAVADRHVSAAERQEVVRFISDLGLAAHLTEPRLAVMFDERARRLEQRDFANVVIDALLPVSDL